MFSERTLIQFTALLDLKRVKKNKGKVHSFQVSDQGSI